MDTDIRLDWGFPNHLKTRRLLRNLGDHGFVCLIRLWCYVGERYKKGVLNGIKKDDLEEICGWAGEPGAFAAYAVRMRWVDEAENGVLSIHDWRDHQPYIFHSDRRSEAASVAAAARWEKYTKRGVNPRRKRDASGAQTGAHAGRNAPAPAPDPDPDPDPKDIKTAFDLSVSVGTNDGANATGNALEAHPVAAPTSLKTDVLKAQQDLIAKRRALGLPDTGRDKAL